MRINKGDKIAGLPAFQVRDILRKLKDSEFTIEALSYNSKTSLNEAKVLADQLEQKDLIAKAHTAFNKQFWRVTLNGSALSLASAAKPIHRKTAEKNLQKLLDRAKTVNSDDYYLYRVSKVIIFGSYLSTQDRINDIDVAVELISKINDKDERARAENDKINEAQRPFINIVDRMFWPRNEVMMFLKSRSPSISLHTVDDEILKICDYKIIYEE